MEEPWEDVEITIAFDLGMFRARSLVFLFGSFE
jgi:hypothetical protein